MNRNLKNAIVIGGVIVALLVVSSFIGGGRQSGGMMGSGMMGGAGWGLFSPVIGLVIMGLIVWGIVLLAQGIASSGGDEAGRRTDSALEILKTRYARGEIGKEEFEEKKKDLS